MNETVKLPDLVQSRIDGFLQTRAPILAQIGADLDHFSSFSRDFLSGGKRFRATFCYWGWHAVDGADRAGIRDGSGDLAAAVSLASGLEVFHAAALVHDDIIDNSDTRRGAPSAHRRFEAIHTRGAWAGSNEAYGRSSALLFGDLLLGWSDELLDDGLAAIEPRVARAVRAEFNRMRTEVTAGQYLDILGESAWRSHGEAEQLARAQQVLIYKSAKYSVESPLALGALLADGNAQQLDALRSFGLPLGVAYQLRDDLLGVFGDESVTGKPSGDDLVEGKRTVLIALTRAAIPAGSRRIFDELLGDPELDATQIAALQATIRESGAVEDVERMIADNVSRATNALSGAPLANDAVNKLRELADTTTRRNY